MRVDQSDNAFYFTVTDLKQFTYCARVFFFEQCLPHVRPRTYKMDAGRDEHEEEQKRATRRSLSKYEASGGQRTFDLTLSDPTLKLNAKLDEVVQTAEGEIFPVDYKLAEKVGENHKLQLAAYGLLLEAHHQQPVRRGFIHLIAKRQTVEVKFDEKLRNQVHELLRQMRETIEQEWMPDPTPQRARCVSCEFRRFCNDVL